MLLVLKGALELIHWWCLVEANDCVDEGKPEVASYALGTIRKLMMTKLILGVAALVAAFI